MKKFYSIDDEFKLVWVEVDWDRPKVDRISVWFDVVNASDSVTDFNFRDSMYSGRNAVWFDSVEALAFKLICTGHDLQIEENNITDK